MNLLAAETTTQTTRVLDRVLYSVSVRRVAFVVLLGACDRLFQLTEVELPKDLDAAVADVARDASPCASTDFRTAVPYPIGGKPFAFAVANLDGVTGLDIAVTNFDVNTLSRLFNRGDGTFVAGNDIALAGNPTGVAVTSTARARRILPSPSLRPARS